ncbi:DNA repair and recombination protein RadA [Halonotius terrestris]|uniref:DNA repair and recombination protein RadA n=1 Tax=Halonotius terrestris TaxID=2487750 RepID=A0A8J8P9V3_9EURY|nr:DNA repair and recombination protein RadA [Halonotius terrestris]TQQ81181.1 DNA repair and recombination protein RadA [Halonotius terrestris]
MVTEADIEGLAGVGPATADKLTDAGYDSYNGLAVASPRELANATDVGQGTAGDIIAAAREAADVGGFESGSAILDHRNEIGKLSTGVPAVDDMLGGGIETQSMTEIYGGFGVGKSQFSHQLAVLVQLEQKHGGLAGRAVLVDTEDAFRPERIDDMVRGLDREIIAAELDRRGIDGSPDDAAAMDALVADFLQYIHVARAFNSDHQMLLAQTAADLATEYADDDRPVRLVIYDSLTAHFRAEYVGRGELAPRQQKLNRHIHDLLRLGSLHNAAILVMNQVQSNPDSYFGDPTKPVGGNILGHASTVRIYLKNSKGTKRVVRLVDAPNLADGEAVLRVEGGGLKPE